MVLGAGVVLPALVAASWLVIQLREKYMLMDRDLFFPTVPLPSLCDEMSGGKSSFRDARSSLVARSNVVVALKRAFLRGACSATTYTSVCNKGL